MTRLLLVEDDIRVRSVVGRGLVDEGYDVDMAVDGRSGLKLALTGRYAAILLDVNLPDMDGYAVCRELRRKACGSGVLMLTARGALIDKVTGLAEGADDYLTKPFDFEELLARVRALVRRSIANGSTAAEQTWGALRIDRGARRAWCGAQALELTPKEYDLLDRLMHAGGSTVSRAALLRDVWNLQIDPGTKVVDVYVRYLRQKLAACGAEDLVETVRGFGYRLVERPSPSVTEG